jgi:hypothetical protein
MADVAEDSEAAGNPRVNRRTRVGVFELENLSRVPGYAYRYPTDCHDV